MACSACSTSSRNRCGKPGPWDAYHAAASASSSGNSGAKRTGFTGERGDRSRAGPSHPTSSLASPIARPEPAASVRPAILARFVAGLGRLAPDCQGVRWQGRHALPGEVGARPLAVVSRSETCVSVCLSQKKVKQAGPRLAQGTSCWRPCRRAETVLFHNGPRLIGSRCHYLRCTLVRHHFIRFSISLHPFRKEVKSRSLPVKRSKTIRS